MAAPEGERGWGPAIPRWACAGAVFAVPGGEGEGGGGGGDGGVPGPGLREGCRVLLEITNFRKLIGVPKLVN